MLLPGLDPMTTLSGEEKSFIADPYAKNSGLLTIIYFSACSGILFESIISVIIRAVPIGTVDFSTKIIDFFIRCSL